MSTLPPWHMLKAKSKSTDMQDMEATIDWVCPPFIQLDKHVRIYRDLMKSTEKVELTLSHSGKKEVFDEIDSPSEPNATTHELTLKHEVILVPIRADMDPRLENLGPDECVKPRQEYTNLETLRSVLLSRAQYATPLTSRGASPMASPRPHQPGGPSIAPGSTVPARPPPPPGGPPGSKPPPPPPPKKPRTEA